MELNIKNKLIVSLATLLLLTGCATRQNPQADAQPDNSRAVNKDPYESYNRSVHNFNMKLDKYLIRPLAKAYEEITPDPVENGIHNFFENLQEPRTIVNSLLQGKFDSAGISGGRLVLNSTVGLLGFFDVAGKMDIPKPEEDFGQTLAAWGVPSGPYLVLPLFGPRYLRHSVGMVPDAFLNPTNYVDDNTVRYGLLGLNIIKSRARLLGTDELVELQLDPYVFIRESYYQQRQTQLNDAADGEDDFDDFEDDFDDDLEDEFDDGV